MKKDIAIVYMAAGLSSRFGGKIKQFAKVGINNETLIEYSLNQAIKSGITKIIFIVGEKTEQPFRELFKENYQGIPVYYALQIYDKKERDKPWGTTDALCSAKNLIDCPFIVCNGDDIYGENTFKILVNHFKKNKEENGASVGFKLINVIPEKGKVNRGIFKTNQNQEVRELKEVFNIEKNNFEATNTKPDNLTSMNIYALYPKTVEHLCNILEKFKKDNKENRTSECLLPNNISELIQKNLLRLKLYQTPDKWIGITNPEDEEIVRKILRNQFQTNL